MDEMRAQQCQSNQSKSIFNYFNTIFNTILTQSEVVMMHKCVNREIETKRVNWEKIIVANRGLHLMLICRSH